MSKDAYTAPTTQSSALGVRTTEKEARKRKRSGFFSGLFQTTVSTHTEGKRSVMPIVLAVVLWGGLVYGGYAFTQYTLEQQQKYVDQRIAQVKEANEKQVKILEEQLVLVQDEMIKVQDGLSSIEEDLKLTGETIGGTNQTKQALQDRIDQLNKQLVELKASLKKLEDAARAW
ncbi:MAG TPA: hypothetical protein VE710_10285 [Candidatus Bathyarchaeia archaeon]|nr:hypothetical protein [Candidatus Bathyarchaeia archaeon]